MNKIIPILHNIRSLHNVGSILRTCDGLGIDEVWVSGYTPYPELTDDQRLPHVSKRATQQIAKTALGAEHSVEVFHFEELSDLATHAKTTNTELVAVEQARDSVSLANFTPSGTLGLVLGNEVKGIDSEMMNLCTQVIELPMKGDKESFNVSVTAGIVLYTLLSQL